MRTRKLLISIALSACCTSCGSLTRELEKIAARSTSAPTSTPTSTPGTPVTTSVPAGPVGNIIGTAVWARSTAACPVNSGFSAVAVDSTGNVYAAGYQQLNGTYTYGTQSANGAATAAGNTVIVKYDSAGIAQWALSNTTGLNGSRIYALAVDSAGNLYAAGSQNAALLYTYGGVGSTGTVANFNVLLIKINPAGAVVWIRTVTAGTGPAEFNAVATDSSGNIYAAGYQQGATTNTYNGPTATSVFAGNNALLVKYDSTGAGIWARAPAGAGAVSAFRGVAADSAGNVYAAGTQNGIGIFTYGGQAVSGVAATTNAVVVKFDSSGTGLWARSTSGGTAVSEFTALAAESGGGIFAAGSQTGNTALNYGSQSVTGAYASGTNALAVKYDSAGNAVWAQSVATGANTSIFIAAAADTSGNMYAAGTQTGNTSYSYGAQSATGGNVGNNISLVKYDTSGNAIWARSASPAPSTSGIFGLAVLNTDFLYAAGNQSGSGSFTYAGQSVSGANGASTNALVLKFQ